MEVLLVVVRPFGGFTRGDTVSDQARIAEILQSEHARDVVRVIAPKKG